MEDKELNTMLSEEAQVEEVKENIDEINAGVQDEEKPLDKNLRLLSPTRMVVRRFFRSKLSIVGLVMLASLFIFCWLGPVVYTRWSETETANSTKIEQAEFKEVTDENGVGYIQVKVSYDTIDKKALPSADHILGTDEKGMDVFTRLMIGGRLSLSISFIAVFLTSAIGIIMGGLAGYYGGIVDNIIMRICDMLMCLPTLPLMLIIGTVLDGNGVDSEYRIYLLMGILSLFSWTGMARLVRGQILFLREQEYMVAAEAMGYSTVRKIFKHLIPNILPQIIVSMTLSLGSMILYESTISYLGIGVRAPLASWGTMVDSVNSFGADLAKYFYIWGPSGICIIIAVLGFNFIGDGLRDALDPKQRR